MIGLQRGIPGINRESLFCTRVHKKQTTARKITNKRFKSNLANENCEKYPKTIKCVAINDKNYYTVIWIMIL